MARSTTNIPAPLPPTAYPPDVAEGLFPLDGPYNEDRTKQAAGLLPALVRYLNHATYSEAAAPYGSTVGSATGSIHATVVLLDQCLHQLAGLFATACVQPGTYVTDDPRTGAKVTPDQAAAAYRVAVDSATNALGLAARHLRTAASMANRVGHNINEETP